MAPNAQTPCPTRDFHKEKVLITSQFWMAPSFRPPTGLHSVPSAPHSRHIMTQLQQGCCALQRALPHVATVEARWEARLVIPACESAPVVHCLEHP